MSTCTCPHCQAPARVHLAGSPSPELLSTRWLLEQRGYRVDCWADLPRMLHPHKPTDQRMLEARIVCMINADAVVITDEMPLAELQVMRTVTSFICRPLVKVDDLPLLAHDIQKRGETFRALDINAQPEDEPNVALRLHDLVVRMRHRWSQLERGFNAKCGWFFTNGQKQGAQQPAPVPYTVHPE